MDFVKTLKLRIKDKHARVLDFMARDVNRVWNFCNETSARAVREKGKFLSGFDLQKLTDGFSKCEGVLIGSATTQQVCEEYPESVSSSLKSKYFSFKINNLDTKRLSPCG